MRRKWESGGEPLQVRCAWILALACIATMAFAPAAAFAEEEEPAAEDTAVDEADEATEATEEATSEDTDGVVTEEDLKEAQEAIGREVASTLIRFVNSGSTKGAVGFPEVDLPPVVGTHRILNVHRNVPGVLSDINQIFSERGANIRAQHLATHGDIGYLIADLDQGVSLEVKEAIAALETNIKTRILY